MKALKLKTNKTNTIKKAMTKFSKKTLLKIEKVLESLEKGNSIERACQQCQLSRTVFYQWRNQSQEHAERFYTIIDSRTIVVEDALFNSAIKGNPTCQIFWLKNRAPERWKEKVELNAEQQSLSINLVPVKK
mgnify:CR=1 FL=1